MALQLLHQLDAQARQRPRASAVWTLDGAAALSWRQWRDASAALARLLRKESAPEAAVLLGVGNHPAFHVAFVAALLADRQVFPVAPESTATEIQSAAARTGAELILGPRRFLERAALPQARALDLEPWLEASEPDADDVWRACEGTGAVLLSSSGTTGHAKIVRRTARSLDAMGASCAEGVGFCASDRVLVTIPAYHSYGMEHGLLAPLWAGSQIQLVEELHMDDVLAQVGPDGPTLFPSVPFVFEALAQAKERADARLPATRLRRAYSAGGPLPPSVSEAWAEQFGLRLGQLYGSTETGSVTFQDPDEAGFAPGSVGRALPGAEIRVLDPDDPDPQRALPAGEEGRVAVASEGMMASYVDDPVTECSGAFFLTSDLGHLDSEGRLTLTGRINLLIDVDGRKINPAEVEALLAQHPAVAEAVVLPLPLTATVNRLKAVLVPADGAELNQEDVRAFARAHLAPHKRPRRYEIRTELPRTATGKICRESLECS
jgi:acyl-CoA synthetase (AMP-forming)/AMP-acid ligase II